MEHQVGWVSFFNPTIYIAYQKENIVRTITVSEALLDNLNIVEGDRFDEKLLRLLETNALMRLKECEERLFGFESKYGMDFDSFTKAWKDGDIKDKHSHTIERDYMEWEGFELERKKWLNVLRTMRIKE